MRRTHYGNDDPIPAAPGGFDYAVDPDVGCFFAQSTGSSVDSLGVHLPSPADFFHGDDDQEPRDR
jgi:hypothetical protein